MYNSLEAADFMNKRKDKLLEINCFLRCLRGEINKRHQGLSSG